MIILIEVYKYMQHEIVLKSYDPKFSSVVRLCSYNMSLCL
jgi:hypothetical protein